MLKSRRLWPPGGFSYFQPQTGWSAPPGLTFEQVVTEIIKHRKANPRFPLPTDFDTVAEELDEYTCLRIGGDPNYVASMGTIPKGASLPPRPRAAGVAGVVGAAKKIGAGVGVLIDWLGSGAKPVESELATARAKVCSDCPQNQQGDFTRWFTVPASNQIRQQVEIKNEMKLATPFDERLHVCEACLCPMKLKVWVPMEYILARLPVESRAALDPRCWMISEEKAMNQSKP